MAKYKCPSPNHNQKTPSFMVYRNGGQTQSCHCFGCGLNGSIIDLHAQMNGLSWHQSIKSFGIKGNIDHSDIGRISHSSRQLNKNIQKQQNQISDLQIRDMLYSISSIGYTHLQMTNFDQQQIQFLQKLYKVIDKFVQQNDLSIFIIDILVYVEPKYVWPEI